jgi:hypothetical protein
VPDPAALTPREIATLLDASRRAVATEMAALDRRAAERLIAGEWCANEIVGHLVEAERRAFAGRIRIILTRDAPCLELWDQPAVAAARHDDLREPDHVVSEFMGVRDDSLILVRSLGPEMLERIGIHPRVGALSVSDLLHEWVHHDRKHLSQLIGLTSRAVWAGMGNARRFSDPDA